MAYTMVWAFESLLAAGVKHITAQPETIFVPSDSALASYAATDPSAFAALKTRAGLHAITSHIIPEVRLTPSDFMDGATRHFTTRSGTQLSVQRNGGQLLAASGGNSAAVIHTTSHGQALLHVVDAVLSPVAISGTSGVEDLTWSYKAIQQAAVDPTLEDCTAFAPNDEALARYSAMDTSAQDLLKSGAGLTAITSHIIPGIYSIEDFPDGAETTYTTKAGTTLTVTRSASHLTVSCGPFHAKVVAPPLGYATSTIYIIDDVLAPVSPTSATAEDLSWATEAMRRSGIIDPTMTVCTAFVPINAAIQQHAATMPPQGIAFGLADFPAGSSTFTSMMGPPLVVTKKGSLLTVSNHRTQANVLASLVMGTCKVHAIDRVLVPVGGDTAIQSSEGVAPIVLEAPLDLPSPGQTDSASGSTHALQLPAIHTAMAASPPAPATAPPTMGVAWPTPPQAHPHLPATANPPGALLSGLAFPVPVAEAPAPAVMDVPDLLAAALDVPPPDLLTRLGRSTSDTAWQAAPPAGTVAPSQPSSTAQAGMAAQAGIAAAPAGPLLASKLAATLSPVAAAPAEPPTPAPAALGPLAAPVHAPAPMISAPSANIPPETSLAIKVVLDQGLDAELLSQALTFFVPNDDAINDYADNNPTAAAALPGSSTAKRSIRMHVIPGLHSTTDFPPGTSLYPTVEGPSLSITKGLDGRVSVHDGVHAASITKGDVALGTGIMHVVDKLLAPSS